MISASVKRMTALATISFMSLVLSGCGGGGLEDAPADAAYVAPPEAGQMKPAAKQKKQAIGVPL